MFSCFRLFLFRYNLTKCDECDRRTNKLTPPSVSCLWADQSYFQSKYSLLISSMVAVQVHKWDRLVKAASRWSCISIKYLRCKRHLYINLSTIFPFQVTVCLFELCPMKWLLVILHLYLFCTICKCFVTSQRKYPYRTVDNFKLWCV